MTDDQLARILHTAMVSEKTETKRDFYGELSQVMSSPAFKAVLQSIRWLSENQQLSHKDATDAIISTFRSLDHIWKDYIHHEGLENLRQKMSPGNSSSRSTAHPRN